MARCKWVRAASVLPSSLQQAGEIEPGLDEGGVDLQRLRVGRGGFLALAERAEAVGAVVGRDRVDRVEARQRP